MDAAEINSVIISGDEVFKIEIVAADVDEISITTYSEGEYAQQIGLIKEIKNNTLFLKSEFLDILQGGFDKLSAHKVFSFQIKLIVPENINVSVASNIATVIAEGKYENLQIQLKQGNCEVRKFAGNALVNTFTGDIFFEIRKNMRIKASSRNGSIEIPDNMASDTSLKLTSISGNIKVMKTK